MAAAANERYAAAAAYATKLKKAKGVRIVERDRGAKLMTTYTPQFLGLPSRVWPWQGGEEHAGDGIVIGVIDTGIDPTHPSFSYDPSNPFQTHLPRFSGACESGPRFLPTSCNGKIVSARYFALGAIATFPLNASMDLLSPFDAVGHGSHVASIAAGNAGVPVMVDGFNYGRAAGMAPRARLAIYKAIYPSGGTLADVFAAMDQAAVDGVDIMTLSIGPDGPPEETLTFFSVFDLIMLFARKARIFVAQAAGNGGPTASSVASFSPWVMGVGATSTDRKYSSSLLLGNANKIPAVGLSGPTPGQGLLVLAKDALKLNKSFPYSPSYAEECQFPEALDPIVVQGRIVICTFSAGFLNKTSTITTLANTAKVLGFMGFVLIANPVYGDFVAPPIPFPIPCIMVPKVADSQIILKYYQHHTYRDNKGFVLRYGAKAAIGEGRVASFSEEAPIVSRFSSRGPDILDSIGDLADVLKPDVVAPGDLVWGAWSSMSVADPILNGYQFALLSGTSMATPHVAGIAALLKQSNPSWTPSMIASAISTTASRFDNRGVGIMAEGTDLNRLYPSTNFDRGAGLINPPRALDPGLVFPSEFKDYIEFLCSLPNMNPATIKVATGEVCNPLLSSHPADLNLPSITVSSLNISQSIHRSVKNVGRKWETYLCATQPPLGVEVDVYPQWFTLYPQETAILEIKLTVAQVLEDFSFGEIVIVGSLDHIVRVPLSILPVAIV